jgi:hypothetical protein
MPAFVETDESVDVVVRGVVVEDPQLDMDAPSLGVPLSLFLAILSRRLVSVFIASSYS